ncbi:hypothetical protein LG276_01845 [Cytobacillus kochii]|uniref:hypothetical protein n=1 Tax=Cytobacillus kochii TaxID=859143 RepID=UPI0025A00D8E|nr:hypothetical protein [Cytobacillus kochii]MDM5205730.1 hypothetical protein [Cytobacillus kochii]
MNQFNIKWQNPIIRLYILGMIPLIVLSIILFSALPSELYWIPNGLLMIGTIVMILTSAILYRKSN